MPPLKCYEHATPETIHEQFIDTTGRIDVTDDGATVTLARRTYTPILLQAGFAELDLPIPLVGRPAAPVQVPLTTWWLKRVQPQSDLWSENRG